MPGGHGSRGRALPLDRQSPFELWLVALYIPLFPAGVLVASLVSTPRTPEWAQWLGRAAFAGVLAAMLWLVSRPRLWELRRRAKHAEPGAAADGGAR